MTYILQKVMNARITVTIELTVFPRQSQRLTRCDRRGFVYVKSTCVIFSLEKCGRLYVEGKKGKNTAETQKPTKNISTNRVNCSRIVLKRRDSSEYVRC